MGRRLAFTYLNQSTLFNHLEQYDKAREVLLKAIDTSREVQEQRALSLATGNLVWVYTKLGDLSEARKILEGWQLPARHSRNDEAQYLLVKGGLEMAEDDDQAALESLNGSLKAAEDVTNPEHTLLILRALKDLAKKMGDLDAYIEHNDAAAKLDEELHGKQTNAAHCHAGEGT